MADQLGFELIYVSDLPHSARSVTDLENGRIYLPPASIPAAHGLRSMALQAMAHRMLGHQRPNDYADFLQQRLEINYYAAACLMPETASVAFLQQAKKDRNLAVEDFRDAFGTTHESAGMRLTNLATRHLDIPLHFLRVDGAGAITRVYENDDLPLPMDVTGAVDGQIACRKWSARSAFDEQNRTTEHYQYTDTPAGTFWCSTQTGTTSEGEFSITVGVPFDDAQVVPRARDPEAGGVDVPRRVMLPAAIERPRLALAGQSLAECARAHADVLALAARCLSRRGRQRGLRVPRPPRVNRQPAATGVRPHGSPEVTVGSDRDASSTDLAGHTAGSASRMVAPARAAKAVAVAVIVRCMTSTAAVGATSAGRATLIVRVSVGSDRRTDRSPGRSMSTIAGTIATPSPRSTNRSTASISAPSSTTSGVSPAARNAASVVAAQVVARAEDDLRQARDLRESDRVAGR